MGLSVLFLGALFLCTANGIRYFCGEYCQPCRKDCERYGQTYSNPQECIRESSCELFLVEPDPSALRIVAASKSSSTNPDTIASRTIKNGKNIEVSVKDNPDNIPTTRWTTEHIPDTTGASATRENLDTTTKHTTKTGPNTIARRTNGNSVKSWNGPPIFEIEKAFEQLRESNKAELAKSGEKTATASVVLRVLHKDAGRSDTPAAGTNSGQSATRTGDQLGAESRTDQLRATRIDPSPAAASAESDEVTRTDQSSITKVDQSEPRTRTDGHQSSTSTRTGLSDEDEGATTDESDAIARVGQSTGRDPANDPASIAKTGQLGTRTRTVQSVKTIVVIHPSASRTSLPRGRPPTEAPESTVETTETQSTARFEAASNPTTETVPVPPSRQSTTLTRRQGETTDKSETQSTAHLEIAPTSTTETAPLIASPAETEVLRSMTDGASPSNNSPSHRVSDKIEQIDGSETVPAGDYNTLLQLALAEAEADLQDRSVDNRKVDKTGSRSFRRLRHRPPKNPDQSQTGGSGKVVANEDGEEGEPNSDGKDGHSASSTKNGQSASSTSSRQSASSTKNSQSTSSTKKGQSASSTKNRQSASSTHSRQSASSTKNGQLASSTNFGQSASSSNTGQSSARTMSGQSGTGLAITSLPTGRIGPGGLRRQKFTVSVSSEESKEQTPTSNPGRNHLDLDPLPFYIDLGVQSERRN